jgi:hypothetical protein
MHRNNLRPFQQPVTRELPTLRTLEQAHDAQRIARVKRITAWWARHRGAFYLGAVGAGIGLMYGLAIAGRLA